MALTKVLLVSSDSDCGICARPIPFHLRPQVQPLTPVPGASPFRVRFSPGWALHTNASNKRYDTIARVFLEECYWLGAKDSAKTMSDVEACNRMREIKHFVTGMPLFEAHQLLQKPQIKAWFSRFHKKVKIASITSDTATGQSSVVAEAPAPAAPTVKKRGRPPSKPSAAPSSSSSSSSSSSPSSSSSSSSSTSAVAAAESRVGQKRRGRPPKSSHVTRYRELSSDEEEDEDQEEEEEEEEQAEEESSDDEPTPKRQQHRPRGRPPGRRSQ